MIADRSSKFNKKKKKSKDTHTLNNFMTIAFNSNFFLSLSPYSGYTLLEQENNIKTALT